MVNIYLLNLSVDSLCNAQTKLVWTRIRLGIVKTFSLKLLIHSFLTIIDAITNGATAHIIIIPIQLTSTIRKNKVTLLAKIHNISLENNSSFQVTKTPRVQWTPK